MTSPSLRMHSNRPLDKPSRTELAEKNWCADVLYKIHLDLHCPDWDEEILSRLDPDQIIRTVAGSGAKMMYFFAKDCYGNAYYDTKLGRRHKCIKNRDFLAEIIKAGEREGVQIVAYYSVIWDNLMARTHPDWRMRYQDGKPASDTVTTDGYSRWQYLCHNSDYLDYVTGMLEEIAVNYPVVGFHLDMLNMDFGKVSCYCDNCRRLFLEKTGKDLPVPGLWDKTWQEFLEFRYDSVERFALGMRSAVHRHRPELPVIMNYHAAPNFDWRTGQLPVRHSLYSDMGTGETYTPLFGDMYPGLESRFVGSLVPGRPFEVVSWRMNRVTDFTTKPRHQMRWELFTSLAHGGSVMIIDQPFHDGWLDEEPYREIGKIFNEIDEKRPYFSGAPVPHAAIYYSARSRDLYGRDQQQRFIVPLQGAYKALIENHINVGFLFDETLTLATLLQYPVVVLPNVGAMSQHEASLFAEYVHKGGTLISSLDTSLYDEDGVERQNYALSEVFGVDFDLCLACDTHFIRNLPPALCSDIHPDYYILGMGKVHQVRITSATEHGDVHESFHKRIIPDHFFSHNIHPPSKRVTGAAYINAFGEGRSIYFPHGIDANYADLYELAEHRIIIGNAVKESGHVPPIEILEAPLNVEFNVNETTDGYVVHALACNPTRQAVTLVDLNNSHRPSQRMDEPMLYKARLRINVPYTSIQLVNDNGRLKSAENIIEYLSEDVHEILVVKAR